ncbi:MAG TPA: alpha-galactosidase, partial [Agriterribacter sp.]|nr:alpha-galactosidase [Agriterribacter sp.]
GAGVQACYRGPQLYDAPETKALVKKWVDFYKKHRKILDADIIHLRRPDGRDYDAILHADPHGREKGLLMVYNPLNETITRNIEADLYYTGLKDRATMSENDGAAKKITLNGNKLNLQVTIPAKSQKWFVFTL